MKHLIFALTFSAISAFGQYRSHPGQLCDAVDSAGNQRAVPCSNSITTTLGTADTITWSRSAPANEVVMKALKYGGFYESKSVTVWIAPEHSDVDGFVLVIEPKVLADFAIIETLYRAPIMINGREMRLFRTKTQVVHLLSAAAIMSDPIPLDLDKVEKINVRLVSESHVSEFWGDTSEIQHEKQQNELKNLPASIVSGAVGGIDCRSGSKYVDTRSGTHYNCAPSNKWERVEEK